SAEERQPGWFYPPTLLTNVAPASTVAQTEIFGPVAVAMPFRTPAEAVALANNTPFGLAASVWTENINLALDVAPRIKAGVVWINTTNQFDAAAGFGGYRGSGFGREGGREGMYEYLAPVVTSNARSVTAASLAPQTAPTDDAPPGRRANDAARAVLPPIDRTAKLYIGGRQARPDSGYTRRVLGPDGRVVGEVGAGSRKDVRNAVEAAHEAASAWARRSGHARAQVLYYVAENLSARAREFAARLDGMSGGTGGAAEVEAAVRRLFTYAAWADKYDGAVHDVPIRAVAFAMHEPIGVVGVACPDEAPLLGFVSLVAPLAALGNAVVAVPSERAPLAATDFYGVLDTSDVPAGVVNIVTGARDPLAVVLAEHDDVDAVWYRGTRDGAAAVERASAGNLKRTWTAWDAVDWLDPAAGEGRAYLRESTQVKNVWVPYGA
ncbi:MAG TPA: aldehyde dehydrogenase family protein, partial [Gemmatirosa sp.]